MKCKARLVRLFVVLPQGISEVWPIITAFLFIRSPDRICSRVKFLEVEWRLPVQAKSGFVAPPTKPAAR